MAKQSAGILLYKLIPQLQVFLVHPGGPFWRNKDEGVWTIPKGEPAEGEDLFETAKREFFEETGTQLTGDFIALDPIVQKGGKKVFAWAQEGDIDATNILCNNFIVEWPPKSGKMQSFPEVDKAGWFTIEEAMHKINVMQQGFLLQLKNNIK